ncbi:MAG: hypothetical protein ACLFU8_05075, partial [Anaerolineales bacterium]
MKDSATVPSLEEFQSWPTARVAEVVRAHGPKVCVFPINGTRRWFMLEYPEEAATQSITAYFDIAGRRHIELYELFFDHGLDTLLTPIFGPELLERGEAYQQMMVPALLWFAENPEFLAFYDAYDVRVHIYGDAERYLRDTPYEPALAAYAEVARRTSDHRSFRLFFGVCAHDATETVAEMGVCYFESEGRLPDRREIVTAYYSEYVEPVDLFIGFDRPSAFDMPLVATGQEDLYFTVSPSPYMDAQTLRAILYDHLYARKVSESYENPSTLRDLAEFYTLNRHNVLGVGKKSRDGSFGVRCHRYLYFLRWMIKLMGVKLNYVEEAQDLVKNLNQRMNPSPYDIAWVARLRDPDGNPRWPELLDWLVEHQHPNGSWGGEIEYYHDRIICTLIALIALRENGSGSLVEKSIKIAEQYIWNHLHLLRRDHFELAGFELILPTLIEEARALNLDVPSHTCGYGEIQTAKLKLIPPDMLYSPYISTVYSLECMGKAGSVSKIRAAKTCIGSVGNSPATTAYYLGLCENKDEEAWSYLESVRKELSDIITVYPFRTFELVWVLNNLLYTDLPVMDFVDQETLQALKEEVGHKGVGFDPTFLVTDGDTTSVCYRVLLSAGVQVDLAGLAYFENKKTRVFRTWDFERNASVSA